MGSIARAHAGKPDPVAAVDPLEVRDIGALAGAGSLKERFVRGRAAVDYLTRGVDSPTRLVAQGGDDWPGYGFELLELGPDRIDALAGLRTDGATINDVLLGALAVAVNRWCVSSPTDT